MNLENLKEKLGDEMFAELKTFVDDLTGQRDTARKESIDGRKTLKAKADSAIARVAELEDWAGIEAGADLAALPAPKGQADAARQFEARLKRAERERDDAAKERDEAFARYRTSQQRATVAEAIGAHDFIDRELVEAYVGTRVVWENDELLFKADDGKLVPVKDGVAGFAKSKPAILKSQGTGGAGFNASAGRNGAQKAQITRAEFEALDPAARAKAAADMLIVD